MPDQKPAGLFVWHEVVTTDRDTAVDFYTRLFGWTVKEMDMGEAGVYPMFYAGDEGVGGAVSLDPSQGIPSHWMIYISVHDVDKACTHIKKLGGQVIKEPFDIPDVGRTAAVQDPVGAYFCPFTGNDRDWTPPAPHVGTFAWHELLSTDVEKAKPFYTDIMGWGLRGMDLGEQGTYWLFRQGDRDTAGAMQMSPDAQAPSNWMPYIGVADVPGTVKKAEKLGGKVWVPPRRVGEPANVHFAVLASPDGASFGLLEMPS